MKKITSKKTFTILSFLFCVNELSAGLLARTDGCEIQRNIVRWNRHNFCSQSNTFPYINNSQSLAHLHFKIPRLEDEFFRYSFREKPNRIDRAVPILIEFNSIALNPQKQMLEHYQTSSHYKEKIISTNTRIEKVNCLYFASGSEYRFQIPAQTGDIRIIIYYDFGIDKEIKRNPFINQSYYESRSLILSQFTFEKEKEYELKIEVNERVKFSNYYYGANAEPRLHGFNISIHELPPNTKFAFDGKDDVGKAYEQVKKEFILFDDGSKYIDPDNCYYESLSDWWNNRCIEGKR